MITMPFREMVSIGRLFKYEHIS